MSRYSYWQGKPHRHPEDRRTFLTDHDSIYYGTSFYPMVSSPCWDGFPHESVDLQAVGLLENDNIGIYGLPGSHIQVNTLCGAHGDAAG